MFKQNEKIRCINNDKLQERLTINKKYIALESDEKMVTIINDDNQKEDFFNWRFKLVNDNEDLSKEEQYLFDSIIAARKVQEFLWGELNSQWDLEEWKRMFQKRIVKINDIDVNNPHAIVELRKRLLQNAALCIALLDLIESKDISKTGGLVSNLPEYEEKLDCIHCEVSDKNKRLCSFCQCYHCILSSEQCKTGCAKYDEKEESSDIK